MLWQHAPVSAWPLGLLGRESVLAALRDRLDRAAAGTGGLVLVTGEAGIGKTAVAEQLVDEARGRGFRVAWSACWQAEVVPPMWPWTSALDQLAEPDHPAPPLAVSGSDPGQERVEQLERVRTWLGAGPDPVLVVVDDLHWADDATVHLLRLLTAAVRTLPVLLVGTARPRGAGHRPYEDVAHELERQATNVALGGLGVADVASVFEAVHGARPSDVLSAHVVDITGGNPLFVTELARSISSEELDSQVAAADLPVPASVQQLVSERAAGLSAAARSLLRVLAVAGDEADGALLRAVSELDENAFLAAFEEAGRAGLVAPDPPMRFVHALFRAALYGSIPATERFAAHEALADRLLAHPGTDPRRRASSVAHHLSRVAEVRLRPELADVAATAARDAVEMLSFDRAVRWYQVALRTADAIPGSADAMVLRLDLADALVGAGDVDESRAEYRRAFDAAIDRGDAAACARAALGLAGGEAGIEVRVGEPEVCAALRTALGMAGDDDRLNALLRARLSIASTRLVPQAEQRDLATSALAAARRTGRPDVLVAALAAWCDVIAGPDGLAERIAAAEEIVRCAAELRSPAAELLGRRLLVEARFERGELGLAEVEIDRFAEGVERLGRSEAAWYPHLWRASLAMARGDLDEHARSRAALGDAVEGLTGTNGALLAAVHDVSVAMDSGDAALGASTWRALLSGGIPPGNDLEYAVTNARIASMAAPAAEVVDALSHRIPALVGAVPDSEWAPMILQAAEVLAGVPGGQPGARDLRARIEPHAEVWAVEGIGAALRGPLHLAVALLAVAAGDDDAAEHFELARSRAVVAGALGVAATITARRDHLLGADAPRPRSPELPVTESAPANRFTMQAETWTVTFEGRTITLRDSKGLRDLATLLRSPGTDIGALDLVTPGPTLDQGDRGEQLDEQARRAYRTRIERIDEELDRADRRGDSAASIRLTQERDALLAELRSGVGLGGRARTSGSSAERARTAVRARIKDALDRIEALDPGLGRHLRRSVQTGHQCSYRPDPAVRWIT